MRLSLCGPNAVPGEIRSSAVVADAPNSPDGLQCLRCQAVSSPKSIPPRPVRALLCATRPDPAARAFLDRRWHVRAAISSSSSFATEEKPCQMVPVSSPIISPNRERRDQELSSYERKPRRASTSESLGSDSTPTLFRLIPSSRTQSTMTGLSRSPVFNSCSDTVLISY